MLSLSECKSTICPHDVQFDEPFCKLVELLFGIADVVADISSTGETLTQNKLKTIEDGTLLKSFASIFVNKRYYKKNSCDLELKRFLDQIVKD